MKNLFTLVFLMFFSFMGLAQTSGNKRKTVSQEKTALTQKIKVFPNPATNIVNILGLVNSDKAEISISDTSGNIILQHQWEIRNNALSIPIPSLPSGIYFISIVSSEQRLMTKFYKQ